MSERLMVFVPMYRCAPQIGRVVAQFDPDVQARFAEILFVDNRSPDDTLPRAVEAATARLTKVRWAAVRNAENYGLGGSHKVAFLHCLREGYDGVVVLHGDDQGSVRDILDPLQRRPEDLDCLLGARFMQGSRLEGYSGFRTLGNHVFNALFSLAAGQRLHDLGAGLNFYRRRFLEDRAFLRCANDLTFNYQLLLQTAAKGASFEFFPLSWREDDQVSNVKMVRQALKTLQIVAEYARGPKAFLAKDHSGRPGGDYRSDAVAGGVGDAADETLARTAGAAED